MSVMKNFSLNVFRVRGKILASHDSFKNVMAPGSREKGHNPNHRDKGQVESQAY